MLRKEWSLIVNSIVMQLAAGLFAFLAVYRWFLSGRAGAEAALQQTASGMLFAGPLIAAGMIVSLFHLGQPRRAYRAIANVKTSWLSREVALTGCFFALWCVVAWLDRSGAENSPAVWLTAAAGLLCVLSMSGIYAATGKPGWSGVNAYLNFFGTLAVFGCVSLSMATSVNAQTMETAAATQTVCILLALLILVARLLYQRKLFSTLESGATQSRLDRLVAASPVPPASGRTLRYRSLTLQGGWLSLGGVALSFFALAAGRAVAASILWIIVVLLVLAGETLQRTGFVSLGLSGETDGRAAG